jgi:hypothetical protein
MNIVRNNDTDHQIFLIKYKKKRTLYPIHPERIGYKGKKINEFSLYRYEIQGNWFVPSNL